MTKDCIDHGRAITIKGGYARSFYEGREQLVHRVTYCLSNGVSIASIKGLVVRHSCDNPRCINPDHLLLGTQGENMDDMAKRGRSGRSKLTREQVLEIRATCAPRDRGGQPPNPYGYSALARKYGVHPNAIREVHLGKSYQHIVSGQ